MIKGWYLTNVTSVERITKLMLRGLREIKDIFVLVNVYMTGNLRVFVAKIIISTNLKAIVGSVRCVENSLTQRKILTSTALGNVRVLPHVVRNMVDSKLLGIRMDTSIFGLKRIMDAQNIVKTFTANTGVLDLSGHCLMSMIMNVREKTSGVYAKYAI